MHSITTLKQFTVTIVEMSFFISIFIVSNKKIIKEAVKILRHFSKQKELAIE